MPEKETIERARADKRQGKSPTTQAGEFVREEIHHVREGKHGARSAKQAIAIGLSKARRAGVELPPPKKGKTSERTRRSAERAFARVLHVDDVRAARERGGDLVDRDHADQQLHAGYHRLRTHMSGAQGRLAGRTAVVTGASSGIGRAIAERLVEDGATVHLVGRTLGPMEETIRIIRADGGEATATVLDVRDDTALAAFIDRVADDAGRLDIMVNNAGLGKNGPILDGDATHWREVFDVNVIALLVGCQAAVRAMRRTGSGGHIINISSIGALKPESGVYGSTKATVNYLNEGLREELEGDDIRVTAIMPGVTATNFVRNLDESSVQMIGAMVGIELDGPRPRAGLSSGRQVVVQALGTTD